MKRPLASRSASKERRAIEQDEYFAKRQCPTFTQVPDVKQLKESEFALVVEGGTVKLFVRRDGELYEASLTKVG